MRIRISIISILLVFVFVCNAQVSVEKLSAKEYDDYILTHLLTPTGPIPTAFDPNGVYPYMSYSENSNRPVVKK